MIDISEGILVAGTGIYRKLEFFEDKEVGTSIRPPLKWAGGKRWLAQRIHEIWHPFRNLVYIEPFCGGLSVALKLRPGKAILNDVNPHLINFYRNLKNGFSVEFEMRNDRSFYIDLRKRFNDSIDNGDAGTPLQAALFYYLNRTCFNGLCRFNNSGHFNVPFGKYKRINYTYDFSIYMKAFEKWSFLSVDFEKLDLDGDSFVYADPPYDVEFTKYSQVDFTWNDQKRLVGWLDRHDGPIVISNQSTERIRDLYLNHGYDISETSAPRFINANGNRSRATEIIATKNL